MKVIHEGFTFDDVLIVPKYSEVSSRKEVDTSTSIFPFSYLKLPIISSNMDTVTGSAMARAMAMVGGIGCLHRFMSIQDNVDLFIESLAGGGGSYQQPIVSVGLGNLEIERAEALVTVGASFLCIDVAHGAQALVVQQVKKLRELFKDNVFVMVGNFAGADSVQAFLERAPEVDALKIGIGPGSACTTRIKTGVGYPQLSAILEIANLLKNTKIPIIADGGLRTPGDIAKAIGAGASAVMVGGMLAGTDETPGEIINDGNGTKYKKYRGSASKESYEVQGKIAEWRAAEGESFLVPCKGSVKNTLQEIEGGLRSAMSYVGAKTLKEFQSNCEFVKVTPATATENGSHGKKT